MKMTEDVLAEYEPGENNYRRTFLAAVVILCLFSAFIVTDHIIQFEDLSWKKFGWDWLDILISFVIPISGTWLFITKKQAGWFICTTFFSFIGLACVITICSLIARKMNYSIGQIFTWRQIFITIAAISLMTLLHTKSIRVFLRIGAMAWIAAIIISCILTAVLFLLG